jgi:hypothetical protein
MTKNCHRPLSERMAGCRVQRQMTQLLMMAMVRINGEISVPCNAGGFPAAGEIPMNTNGE